VIVDAVVDAEFGKLFAAIFPERGDGFRIRAGREPCRIIRVFAGTTFFTTPSMSCVTGPVAGSPSWYDCVLFGESPAWDIAALKN
jgi:hypothetical protein